jgi:hypothetical protein
MDCEGLKHEGTELNGIVWKGMDCEGLKHEGTELKRKGHMLRNGARRDEARRTEN